MAGAVTLDIGRVRRTLDDQVGRLAALLRSVRDPWKNAIGRWNIAETAAHIIHSTETNAAVVRGEGSPLHDVSQLGDFNDLGLQEMAERDPKMLAADLEKAGIQIDEAISVRGWDDPVTWHGGIELPAAAAACFPIGECAVHGLDIARAAGSPWPIPREHAALAFDAYTYVLPHYLDRDKAAGVRLAYDIRMRGGSRVHLLIEDQTLRVERPSKRRIDCHISADPVAYLLVGYNRESQWKAIATWKLAAWGRKPWVGAQMPQYLAVP